MGQNPTIYPLSLVKPAIALLVSAVLVGLFVVLTLQPPLPESEYLARAAWMTLLPREYRYLVWLLGALVAAWFAATLSWWTVRYRPSIVVGDDGVIVNGRAPKRAEWSKLKNVGMDRQSGSRPYLGFRADGADGLQKIYLPLRDIRGDILTDIEDRLRKKGRVLTFPKSIRAFARTD